MSGTWSGGYLRALRDSAGLDLAGVAERLRERGYDVTALEVEDWESDRVIPSADAAWPLMRVLGLERLDDLFAPAGR